MVLLALLLSIIRAEPTSDEILKAVKRSAEFFHGSVARHGGYVYYCSLDFSRRLGEGVASDDQVWVQPPATPTVGMAYLGAFEVTKDEFYLDAALDAAAALLHGQLASGGWTNAIDFDPKGSRAARYRNGRGKSKGKNFSTLDDDISQSALRFLMQLDEATGFKKKDLHEGVGVALEAMLKAQFPIGAFPQGWDEELARFGGAGTSRGNYPNYDWRTEGRIKEFWDRYNLNDGIAPTVADTLILAHQIYGRGDCAKALKLLGDFLVLAQMPEPQPAWAQQYNDDLQPIWARKFEPPAIASRESEGVVTTLLKISIHCRDRSYLKPIPAALDYLERSELPDGQLARFYELKNNKPLYMVREGKGYRLTNDDSKLPSHYGWKNPSRVQSLRAAYESVLHKGSLPDTRPSPKRQAMLVKKVLSSLDEKGRWVSTYAGESLTGQPKFKTGERYLDSGIFSRNLGILSKALEK